MNDFGRGVDGRDTVERDPEPEVSALGGGPEPYNRRLLLAGRGRVAEREHVSADELRAVHAQNEHAACRNVGLSIETRPDLIDEAEVVRLRALGCTKVQLGLQSLSDDVL